jgi:hypothetical protein
MRARDAKRAANVGDGGLAMMRNLRREIWLLACDALTLCGAYGSVLYMWCLRKAGEG